MNGKVLFSNGIAVPAEIKWEWGPLFLMPKQQDGLRYYVYRRDSVQGKFTIVRVDGEVICTCQTKGGAFRCAEELNNLAKGGCNAEQAVRAV